MPFAPAFFLVLSSGWDVALSVVPLGLWFTIVVMSSANGMWVDPVFWRKSKTTNPKGRFKKEVGRLEVLMDSKYSRTLKTWPW